MDWGLKANGIEDSLYLWHFESYLKILLIFQSTATRRHAEKKENWNSILMDCNAIFTKSSFQDIYVWLIYRAPERLGP